LLKICRQKSDKKAFHFIASKEKLKMNLNLDLILDLMGNVLLFMLVYGMSATVNAKQILKQLHNRKAILTAISLQFILLPFLGFLSVKFLKMGNTAGIMLLVVTSSPGGSYSNW